MLDLSHCVVKLESCYYSDKLLTKLSELNEYSKIKVDLSEIKKAIYYAKKYHANQIRLSGEPF